MNEEPDYKSLDPEERTNKFLALFSVVMGVASLCAGLIPIAGIIVGMIGTVMAIFGMRSEQRKMAMVGFAISTFGLLTSVIYMILKSLNIQL